MSVALCLTLTAGNHLRMSIDGANQVGYFEIYIDSADTGTGTGAGIIAISETGQSDTIDLRDWPEIDVFFLSLTRVEFDTGSVDDDDGTLDSMILYLFTSMVGGAGKHLYTWDTLVADRDSIIWRGIPKDSLFDFVWIEWLYWDSLTWTAQDTNSQTFTIDAYGQ
jgi:hypothetical protein